MIKKNYFTLIVCLLILPLMAGATWTTKRLTYNSGYSYGPAIIVDSNNHIHLVWEDDTPGTEEIYHKKSTDGGTTWGTKRLTYNAGTSFYAAITIDSYNHIHLVWMDSSAANLEIYYKKSTTAGDTWTTKRLTWTPGSSLYPDIVADSNNYIHLVWGDNNEIYYRKSTNGGDTWTTKRLTHNSGNSFGPAIAVGSNNHIHVVWTDETSANKEIYYKKSTNGGDAWTTKRLTYNSGNSFGPAIAVGSNNHIHVVWGDDTPGNNEIYYRKSTNGGTTWDTKRLTWNSGYSDNPKIAINSNNHIYVLWDDDTPGNSEIYYRKSTNGGTTWDTKRLTWNSGDSDNPTITVDSNNHIHVLWDDDTPGNKEIYYKKNY
jgi:hypothetical protein